MKAILYQRQGQVQLEEAPVPVLAEGEALIAVEACGLCGSDLLKIDSKLAPPVPLGHEVAGRVVELGRGARGLRKGQRVVVAHHVPCLDCHYCRRGSESMCREFKASNLDPGGLAQLVRASAPHVRRTVLPIPAGLDFAEAAMTEPLACCLRNVRRTGLGSGDCAGVVGLGFIGLLTGQILALRGVEVLGFDLEPARVRLAQRLGLEHCYTGRDGRAGEIVADRTGGRGLDALVFTAGAPSLVAERLSWVRDGGMVNVFAGFSPDPHVRLDLDEVYHRELTLTSSYSPALEDLREALALLAQKRVDVSHFTQDRFPLDRFQEALRQVRGREILKAILLPQRSVA